MLKSYRVMVLVLVLVLVAAGVCAVAVSELGSTSHSVQALVSAAHGGSISLGGATLTAAPGAVSGTGKLTATMDGAPPAGTGGDSLAGAAPPIRFSLTGARLVGSLLVTFRVAPSPLPASLSGPAPASAVWLSFYDPATGQWREWRAATIAPRTPLRLACVT
jgi:hypothetical protein